MLKNNACTIGRLECEECVELEKTVTLYGAFFRKF